MIFISAHSYRAFCPPPLFAFFILGREVAKILNLITGSETSLIGDYKFLSFFKILDCFEENGWMLMKRFLLKLKEKSFPKPHKVDKVVAKLIATCGIHFSGCL